MANPRIALYTFGVFRLPSGDPVNQGFHDRNDLNFEAAERSEGFIARSGYDGDPGPESWGDHAYPRFYVERGDGHSPSTLSLWTDLESPMAFAYAGVHAEALKHGRDWFMKPKWPPYALWWVDSHHIPTWQEAVERHEHLHDHGPRPYVFDLKTPFGPDGATVLIDRKRVRQISALNAARQSDLSLRQL